MNDFFETLFQLICSIYRKDLDTSGLSKIKTLSLEILRTISKTYINVLRNEDIKSILQELFENLFSIFNHCKDIRYHWGVYEFIKPILQSPDDKFGKRFFSRISGASSLGLEDLLNWFYPKYASIILQPLISKGEYNGDIIFLTCDLLKFFIVNHKYRIKYLLLRSSIPQSLYSLLNHKETFIRLSVLGCLKAMLLTKDDFYCGFFIKRKLLLPLLQHLKIKIDEVSNLEGGQKEIVYDCCTCAVLEIFTLLNQTLIENLIHNLDPELFTEVAAHFTSLNTLKMELADSEPIISKIHSKNTSDATYNRILEQEAENDYFLNEDEDISKSDNNDSEEVYSVDKKVKL